MTDAFKRNGSCVKGVTSNALKGHFGLEIRGLNLLDAKGSEWVTPIAELLYEHAVVCFRQQAMTPAQMAAFGRGFGQLIHHTETDLRLDGLPGVMSLSNADDRDERQLNGGSHWHTDLIHSAEPASFTMLNAISVPESGGATLFADQAQAFRSLKPADRELAEALTVVHCYEGRTDGSVPQYHHALVRDHPVTGRKSLYGAADTGVGLVGHAHSDAVSILRRFEQHATQSSFVYRHEYQLNDLVIWDNAQLLHCAEPLHRAHSAASERIMHRVSVRGWPRGG